MTRWNKIIVLGAALAALAAASVPALADRRPTLEERSRIESKLKELGYTSWDKIDFDDDYNQWEVEDARTANGYFDLKLDPKSLDVTSRKRDD